MIHKNKYKKDFKKEYKTDLKKANRENRQNGSRIGRLIDKYTPHIGVALLALIIISSGVAFADADGMWTTITDILVKWIKRVGGLTVFIGGVMAANGQISDHAEQRTRGFYVIAGGGMIFAVAAASPLFLA